jgi:hypothetical protein
VKLLDTGEPQSAVARLLNVDQSTISRLAATCGSFGEGLGGDLESGIAAELSDKASQRRAARRLGRRRRSSACLSACNGAAEMSKISCYLP